MRWLIAIAAIFLIFGATYGCRVRQPEDRASQGAEGPMSPAESGQHGATAYNRPPYGPDAKRIDAEHQTAGLTGPLTDGKEDPTMEGSGNLAWQGSYEREKRAGAQRQKTP